MPCPAAAMVDVEAGVAWGALRKTAAPPALRPDRGWASAWTSPPSLPPWPDLHRGFIVGGQGEGMHEMAIAADRFAILGCAYGNRRALRACLADAGDLPALSCGDLVGFCGRSDLVCDLLREAFVAAIAGNHEREAAAGSALCGCGHRDAEDERMSCLAAAAQLDGLSPDDQERLAQLPERLIVRATGGSLLLAHGSPDRINEFLHERTLDRDRVRRWLDAAEAEVLAVSHSGLPWVVELGDGRLAVNCGSAGRPDHDGDPAVHYARIALSPRPEAEIRRVVYDHAAAAAELERNGIDPRFTAVLRTGVWTSGIGSLPPEERDRPARGPSFLPLEAIA